MTRRRYLLVLAAFGSQRLVELLYSSRNERKLRRIDPLAPQAAPSLFKWIVVANVSLFTMPIVERWWRRRRAVPPVMAAIGWAGAIGAAGIRLWVIGTLRQSWTVRAVVPTKLQVEAGGPYRWIRHPNYLALLLEFAALPLIGGAYLCAIALSAINGILLWGRITAEESLLQEHAEYRRLMGGKPRFFPRMGARPTGR